MFEATQKRAVRIGQAGLRNHGRTILTSIGAVDNLRIVSCFDTDEDAMNSVSVEYGIRGAGSFEELVADPGIDAVALASPNHLHARQALAAMERGKHVFVEKPIANTMEDARSMIDAASAAGLVLSVGHNTRRRKSFREAKRILDAGVIGTPVGAEANLSRRAGIEGGMPGWKGDPDLCILLPMSQLGIHFVDAARYFFGDIRYLQAEASSRAMRESSCDTVNAVLLMEPGLPVSILASYSTLDTFFFRIYGTDGIITCEAERLTVEHVLTERKRSIGFPEEGLSSFIEQMREFGDCVLHGTRPETDGESALKALQAVLAMQEAAESGHRIAIG